MKQSSEAGNALVEFVAFGLIVQLFLFGFLIKLGFDFRSQLAAEALARQTLRSIQNSTKLDSGPAMAENVANEFGIAKSEYTVSVQDGCPSALTVRVKVRSNDYVAKGFCLK